MPSFRLAVVAFAAAAALSACGHSRPVPQGRSGGAAREGVKISDFSFHPPTIEVRRGARIAFTNRDHTAHTATATAGVFDTGAIPPGATRTITFTKPGVYTYYCQFHAFMRGQIVVK